MSITKDVPVPTSYKRLHESKMVFNIHDRVIGTNFILFGICVVLINRMMLHGVYFVYYFIPVIVCVSFFIKFTRDVETLDKNKLRLLLFFRIIRKKNVIRKYDLPIDDLKKILNIDSIQKTGTIRYRDDSSGVLVLYKPPRTPDNEQDIYSTHMKNLINTLYDKFEFQFMSNSVVDATNPLTDIALEEMKNPDLSPQTREHLQSLYEESKKKHESIEWEFKLLLTIPETKSIEKAEKMRNAFIPGLQKSFKRAGAWSRVVDNRNEVIYILRSHLT